MRCGVWDRCGPGTLSIFNTTPATKGVWLGASIFPG